LDDASEAVQADPLIHQPHSPGQAAFWKLMGAPGPVETPRVDSEAVSPPSLASTTGSYGRRYAATSAVIVGGVAGAP
jgi:hypothetical protein